jgi:hypothetical protein
MTEHNKELEVPEFFEDEHAIGLIALIDREHGNIYTELLDKVTISDNTLRDMLNDAIKVDLIEETTIRAGDHPRSTRFQLRTRGKAIQSLLRGMGFDDMQQTILDYKRVMDNAAPDVQRIIEDENLHKKYPQRDYWGRTGSKPPEIDVEQLVENASQEHEELFEPTRPSRSEIEPEIIGEEDDGLKPTETWGDTPDKDSNQDE